MDFVERVSGSPVNSPFEHELWSIPDPDAPHLQLGLTGRLSSMERCHGIAQDKIRPGEEKFLLRDGQMCLLKRPGKQDLCFRVPLRREKRNRDQLAGIIMLDFPRVLEE